MSIARANTCATTSCKTACETPYESRVRAVLEALCIPPEAVSRRGLPLQPEALRLEPVGAGDAANRHQLIPEAADAWRRLHACAAADGVPLRVVSAFRDLERQADILRVKLLKGVGLEAIFAASAPPGYSEHHTGRAIDVTTDGVRELEEEFETTAAFQWLTANAHRFGFSLSYPRDNASGFIYEPWHWFFDGERPAPDGPIGKAVTRRCCAVR